MSKTARLHDCTKFNRLTFQTALPGSCRSKNKIYRSNHTQSGPDVIQFERLLEVKQSKRYEYRKRNCLLNNFELTNTEASLLKADAVCRHLKRILK